MGPEGVIIIIALLWGPTAIWLILRTARAHEERRFESREGDAFARDNAAARAADPATTLIVEGHWICAGCRSLNLAAAKRCYSCRTRRDTAALVEEEPAREWVPVMAETTAPATLADAVAELTSVAVAVTASSGAPDDPLPSKPVVAPPATPVPAAAPPPRPAPARSGTIVIAPSASARAAAKAAQASEAAGDRPASSTDGSSPQPPGVPAEPATCPFLGMDGDRTTRFDFPTAGNVCHASTRDQGSKRQFRRFFGGNGGRDRGQPIGLDMQASRCLTPSHAECPLYVAATQGPTLVPAADVVATAPGSPAPSAPSEPRTTVQPAGPVAQAIAAQPAVAAEPSGGEPEPAVEPASAAQPDAATEPATTDTVRPAPAVGPERDAEAPAQPSAEAATTDANAEVESATTDAKPTRADRRSSGSRASAAARRRGTRQPQPASEPAEDTTGHAAPVADPTVPADGASTTPSGERSA
jgi:flagellar hook-length control protein FliK